MEEKNLKSISYYISYIIHLIMDNKGLSVFLCCILGMIYSDNTFTIALIGSMVYTMVLLRELLDHKKEKDQLDSIDLEYFQNANKNLEDPLDGYVDMCINEYMLLNRNFYGESYIKEKEEMEIRKGVIELLSSNLGPEVKKKFELYYGKGQVEAVLARKCFIRISLYVANVNKSTYVDANADSKDFTNIFNKSIMMNADDGVKDLYS